MSALEFQRALAHRIRFPDQPAEEFQSWLRELDLTSCERDRLATMAGDPLVSKFGQKMRYCRQRDACEVLRLSREFLSEADLTAMFRDRFEPTRSSTDFVMLGVQFLEFALRDEVCLRIIARGKPFLKALLAYDYARAFIERQVIVPESSGIPAESLLRHGAFLVVELDFDVPRFARARNLGDKAGVEPAARALQLLFLRVAQAPYYRVFEIDATVAAFLAAQSRAPETWTDPLPAGYPGMVAVGLCRPLASA